MTSVTISADFSVTVGEKEEEKQPMGLREWSRRWLNKRWRFLAGTSLALAIVFGAFVLLDPHAAPTTIDADGQRVKLAPIDAGRGAEDRRVRRRILS